MLLLRILLGELAESHNIVGAQMRALPEVRCGEGRIEDFDEPLESISRGSQVVLGAARLGFNKESADVCELSICCSQQLIDTQMGRQPICGIAYSEKFRQRL